LRAQQRIYFTDYRFAGTPWHVNMQGRYGSVNKINRNSDDSFGG
jgi:hypothetical protein